MNAMADQAEGLRRMLEGKRTRVIAVAGWSAGAGVTTTAMHLAAQLAHVDRPVLLIDENARAPGSACAGWGVRPASNLGDVAARRVPMDAAAAAVGPRLAVLAAEPSEEPIDPRLLWPGGVVLVDARVLRSGQLSSLARLADDVVVVMRPTAASITATYAGLKRLQFTHALQVFHFLLNQVVDAQQATIVSRNVMEASRRFLAVSMQSLGSIADDSRIREAAPLRTSTTAECARAPAGEAFRRVAAAFVAVEGPAGAAPAARCPPVPSFAGAPA